MKDGATFINTARGALVDEDALVAELQTGRISAMLDVTWPEPPARDIHFTPAQLLAHPAPRRLIRR